MDFIILTTERIMIRKFNYEDINLIYDINNDPECIKFNGWNSMSYEECKKVLERWINQYDESLNTGAFCVEKLQDNEKIGMAFIVPTNEKNEYEIGFRLRKIYWNNGFAKEISRGFITYSKYKLNAKSIVAEVDIKNSKSINVFNKLAFIQNKHPKSNAGLIFRYEIN